MPAAPKTKAIRLQGTDGIRREVRPQKDFKNLTPQQVFLRHGIITEEFLERYAYCHVRLLIQKKQAKAGDGFAVGWDPRDPKGFYTDAVVRGIRKAGGEAWVLGVVPTPLVPMYMLAFGAKGGFMVTASHNPKDQNGVKIFLAYRGLKMLPENDIELSRAVLAQGSLKSQKKTGLQVNKRKDALRLFKQFHHNPLNSWSDNVSFDNICLVVDPARGALSGLAAEVFREAGFKEVHEVNNKLDGQVNHYSGVADLEGTAVITAEMAEAGGRFRRYPAIQKLFQLGRKHRSKARNGRLQVAGAVFDADGDRFYRLDYHPFQDTLLVSAGDQTAYWQARHQITVDPKKNRNSLYLYTVESDLNTAAAVETLGLKPGLTPVGDKWVLWRIAHLILNTRFKALGLRTRKHGDAKLKQSLKKLKNTWSQFKKSGKLDVGPLQELESGLDRILKALPRTSPRTLAADTFSFAVGSEETGHNITTGWLEVAANRFQTVHCGNGLKSALNTFAATETLLSAKSPETCYAHLAKPFTPGHKATLYVYYIDQTRFHRNSKVWSAVKQSITTSARDKGYRVRMVSFPEDPEMLYLELQETGGRGKAAVFVRNSGTENKISVNLRGRKKDARTLDAIGVKASRILLEMMKDPAHTSFSTEQKLLERLQAGPQKESSLLSTETERRVMHEIFNQGLAEPSPDGIILTAQGRWYLQHLEN